MGYPATAQYSVSHKERVFAIRVCKSNEAKAMPFYKPKAEQISTLSCNNKNHDTIMKLVPDYKEKERYKFTGIWDSENKVMYFYTNIAVVSAYQGEKN